MAYHDETHRAKRSYPLQCWWVAAFSDEIGRELTSRSLLETPVLMYRTAAGEVVAMEDRCPHRAAPLSLGTLLGDDVVCGYHGFQFGPSGRCTRVPSQSAVPSAVRTRTFPVIEQAPFVWIFLGDTDRLDRVPPPTGLDWADDDAFTLITGQFDIAANYMLLKENVLDLTHFGYVHAKSFGITDWTDPPEVTVNGDIVTYRQEFPASPLAAHYAWAMEIEADKVVDRVNYGSFVSPALQISAGDFHDPAPAPGHRADFHMRICHATTPVDEAHMHYFWAMGRDYGAAPEVKQKLRESTMRGFEEDRVMLEAVQAMMLRVPFSRERPEVSVKADTAAIQARRALARWMDREEDAPSRVAAERASPVYS